jgi:uncharacterized Zn finger protein (UPF0148 family)
MNATVTCEKCGKPLGVFDGNTCADCSKIEQIRKEISEWKDDKVIHAERNEMVDIALEIIDKYTK